MPSGKNQPGHCGEYLTEFSVGRGPALCLGKKNLTDGYRDLKEWKRIGPTMGGLLNVGKLGLQAGPEQRQQTCFGVVNEPQARVVPLYRPLGSDLG